MQDRQPSEPNSSDAATLGHRLTNVAPVDSSSHGATPFDSSASLGCRPTDFIGTGGKPVLPDWGAEEHEQRYDVQSQLGQGGMGQVDLALDRRLRRLVAIKRIRLDIQHCEVIVSRFVAEATALASLPHPNIVQIYDFGQDAQGLYLVMEYLAGGSLADLLRRQGPLTETQVLDYLLPLCDALRVAHEAGIVHRDIKPGNVLLSQDGRPKLTDFGLVKMLRQATELEQSQLPLPSITVTGVALGTVDYMPPEQRQALGHVDARSDIWSLAATAYELLTGQGPRTIRLDRVPLRWQAILSRALEESPDQRFQSAADFRQAMSELPAAANPHAPLNIVTGQCHYCHAVNDTQRRFCHACSKPLYRPCRSCQTVMAVWYDVCGECGKRQSEVLEERRLKLIGMQQQAEAAAAQGNYLLANKLSNEIREGADPDLGEITSWLDAFAPELDQRLRAQRLEITRLIRAAVESLEQYDYAQAVKSLSLIPVSVHGTIVPGTGNNIDHLLRQTRAKAELVQQLDGKIRIKVKEKQLDDLLPIVEQFLLLQPTHAKVLKLAEQLRSREARQAPLKSSGSVGLPVYLKESGFGVAESQTPHDDSESDVKPRPSIRVPFLSAGAFVGLFMMAAASWFWFGKTDQKPTPLGGANTQVGGTKDAIAVAVVNSLGMSLQLVNPGSFTMGSPLDEEGRNDDEVAQRVNIRSAFYLGTFEVSVAQYNQVMELPSPTASAANLPKTDVTWEQAIAFCSRLSRHPEERKAGREYYLPTESQWEYACRANTTTPIALNSELESIPEYTALQEKKLLPVNATTANAWGLYGMNGNAREWVSSWYGPTLVFKVELNGPPFGEERVVRGAKFGAPFSFRSAFRDRMLPHQSTDDLGFRVAMKILPKGLRQVDPMSLLPDNQFANAPKGKADDSNFKNNVLSERRYTTQELAAQKRQLDNAVQLQLPVEFQNTVGMKFRWCPPGAFNMGSPLTEAGRGDDEMQHHVELTRGYYLGIHEVTRMQYELVTGTEPRGIRGRHKNGPASGISFADATKFCELLAKLPTEAEAGRRYRLPTEAEWEYACRADTQTAYFFGDDPIHYRDYVTIRDHWSDTAQVAEKWPNAWGFYDMLGAPFEYCSGWYGLYPAGKVQDPDGPVGGTSVIVRGGFADRSGLSEKYDVVEFRSAKRSKTRQGDAHADFSFRVVMIPRGVEETETQWIKKSDEAPIP